MIIIPIKWLFHWEYTLFSDKPKSPFFLDREPFNHQISTSGGLVQRQDGRSRRAGPRRWAHRQIQGGAAVPVVTRLEQWGVKPIGPMIYLDIPSGYLT